MPIISSTGGSFIYRSSISKLFKMVFNEEVIELFSTFIVISFLALFLTLKPEFSSLIASSSDRQTIKISLTEIAFLTIDLVFHHMRLIHCEHI